MVDVCAKRLLLYRQLYEMRKEDDLFRPRVEYRSLETPRDRQDRVRRVLAKIDTMEKNVRALRREHVRHRRGSDVRNTWEVHKNDKVTNLHRMASELSTFLCEVMTSIVVSVSCRVLARALFLELRGIALTNQISSLQAGGGLPFTPAGEQVLQHFVDLRLCFETGHGEEGSGVGPLQGVEGEGNGTRGREEDEETPITCTNPHERHSITMKAFDIIQAMQLIAGKETVVRETLGACHETIEYAIVNTPLEMDRVEVGLVDRLSHALAGILRASPSKGTVDGQAIEMSDSTSSGTFFTIMNVAPHTGLRFTEEHRFCAFSTYCLRDWLEVHDTVPQSLIRAVTTHTKRLCEQIIGARMWVGEWQGSLGAPYTGAASTTSPPSASGPAPEETFPSTLRSLAAESYVNPWTNLEDEARKPEFVAATACEVMSIVDALICRHEVRDAHLLRLARTLARTASRDVGFRFPLSIHQLVATDSIMISLRLMGRLLS